MTIVCGVLLAAVLPASASAFGVENWFAANCKVNTCKHEIGETPAKEKENAEKEGFTQAAGHPNFGITDFTLKKVQIQTVPFPAFAPEGNLKNLRVDVAPGVSTNPEAVTKCSLANFTGTEIEPVPGTKAFTAPNCPGSEIGENKVTTLVPTETAGVFADVELSGNVYNLEQTQIEGQGWSSVFGVALDASSLFKLPPGTLFFHTLILGNVEWGAQSVGTGKGDYHDYFEIRNITQGLISSRLSFKGNIGTGGFLTNPSICNGPGPNTTTRWRGEPYPGEGSTVAANYTTPIGSDGCNNGSVPFEPSFAFTPGIPTNDTPDPLTAVATLPHNPSPAAIDDSQVKTASITLPEGMTLNPSAAAGLTACTPAQARIHGEAFGTSCPASSSLGSVTLDVPGLPPGSLTGNAFLGGPESGPITGPPYTMYVVASSTHYNVSVRLKAEVFTDPTTGRITTVFNENPEQPFSKLTISFGRGALTPVANPLICGTPSGVAAFVPVTGTPASKLEAFGAGITGCASPTPAFKPSQSTTNSNGNGGASTTFGFNLGRSDGEQYVGSVRTELPPGLVGNISKAERCAEPAASSETTACPAGSQIGVATVKAGSGPEPFTFTGPVYLTGPYNGFPYGLSIKVPAVAGPFNLGNVVTRAGVTVNPLTSQVIVQSTLPRIHSGIPLRIKTINVTVNKSGFMINPTNCGAFKTVSSIGGFAQLSPGGATATSVAESPFQVANCNKLKFSPKFSASSSSKTSRSKGALLVTEVKQGSGQANIKSVKVQLPRSLPSRLTTLQKACTEQVFAVNPLRCPSGAFVGGAVVHTPTLPQPLRGPAILVSHAGAAFPDLDLVVEDPNHLRVILVGNTNIKNSITTTTFASTPDVPVSSVRVELPTGSHSALAAFGNICSKSLVMPTTMTAQNGKTFKQNTIINVGGCPVEIVGRKVVGNFLYVTARVPAAGRVSVKGAYLVTKFASAKKAHQNVTLKVALTSAGQSKKPLHVHFRVGFSPKQKHGKSSAAFSKVTFG
ncbi:MAG TPA: hypothetical protein VNV44_06505 [Solirubrobacteraceae bacterium]|nr:hypothetical protein [Solirubrobacteraceae bacterium]